MSGIEKIDIVEAPKALGPYSQAVTTAGLIFCSGQLGIDPETNNLQQGIAGQTRQALNNLKAVLAAAGSVMDKVVRCDIFFTDLKDFNTLNEVYAEFFIKNPKPARQTVQVSGLPKNALVEISCIAIL